MLHLVLFSFYRERERRNKLLMAAAMASTFEPEVAPPPAGPTASSEQVLRMRYRNQSGTDFTKRVKINSVHARARVLFLATQCPPFPSSHFDSYCIVSLSATHEIAPLICTEAHMGYNYSIYIGCFEQEYAQPRLSRDSPRRPNCEPRFVTC